MNRGFFSNLWGKLGSGCMFSFLIFWSIVVVFPMIWVLVSAFKTDAEIFFSPWLPPAEFLRENFVRAWSKADIGLYLLNTLIVNIPAIFFTLLFSAMAAYVLARFEFPGETC